ncbi:hypothetical protein ACJ41O_008480 [Fusarium nematophilum]
MFGEGIRGSGMVVLQVLRGLTIIGLLAATVACWVLIVKIDTSSNGFFVFEGASLFFTSTAAGFLIASELPLAKSYFRRVWPVLSDKHGLTWLGVAMMLIGCNILGKLNHPSNDSDKIGLPFWRLALAAGILVLTFGVFNIVSSLIFHDGANSINARIVREDGTLAKAREDDELSKSYSIRSGSSPTEKPRATFMSFFWKKDANKSPSRPNISPPMPRDYDVERHAPAHFDQRSPGSPDEDEYDRRSPIMPEVRRPDTALHPMHTGRSSYYSEAHLSRF